MRSINAMPDPCTMHIERYYSDLESGDTSGTGNREALCCTLEKIFAWDFERTIGVVENESKVEICRAFLGISSSHVRDLPSHFG